jgi:YegS/Rv2252/BmrU family lipid kinase
MIAVLVNPLSGNKLAYETGQQLQDILKMKKREYALFSNAWPKTLDGFSEAWIVGGDGTINFYLNHYKENRIPIVIFGAGTGNDFAWKLYGDMSLKKQVDYVLNAEAKNIDTGVCNEMLYVNSAGIGFDGEVLKSMKSIRKLGGHLGYLWIVIKKIFNFKEYRFKITFADKVYDEKFLLVAVNNSTRTGGGFFVTPNASLTDGKLDMLLCKPLGLFKRLRFLPVIEKGKHLHLPFIEYQQANNITIETAVNVYAQLDGELIEGNKFVFGILPGWLKIKY